MKRTIVDRNRSEPTRAERKPKTSRKDQMEPGANSDPHTLLVPTDFSAGSLRALDCAKSLARKFNAAIILIHVIDPLHAPGRFDTPRLRSLRKEALEDAKSKLAEVAEAHSDSSDPLESQVIDGVVHISIVKFAKKSNAGWIVMGSKGQTGMKRLLAGSVAENVVRNARCPVLVVP